jgi:hypothetical protein
MLPTSILYTPGAQPSDPVIVRVIFNNGQLMRGGVYSMIINSGTGDNGVQDVAGNALDGNYYGHFSTGDGLPGGNFVATVVTHDNIVRATVPIQDGYVPPAAAVDPPAGSATHLAGTTHKHAIAHKAKPAVPAVTHHGVQRTRAHDAALKALHVETHPWRRHR